MAVKFDFLSPGVQLREFDKSQIPAIKTADGICIIGTAPQGPGNIPVKVSDMDTFEALYGTPSPGRGQGIESDYRTTSFTDVNYGMYAAQAWLETTDSPVTFIRLIGEKSDAQTTSGLLPGWKTTKSAATASSDADVGGAYGLFMFPSASNSTSITGTLAAIFYSNEGALRLSGTLHDGGTLSASCGDVYVANSTGFGAFTLEHVDTGATSSYDFDFTEGSTNFIRDAFSTDPQKTNSDVTAIASLKKADEHMWLGESYGEMVSRIVGAVSGAAGKQTAVLLHMGGGSTLKYGQMNREATYSKSGWFFSHDSRGKGNYPDYSTTGSVEKLFRIASIYKGSQCQNQYKVKIEVKQINDGNDDGYSRFDLHLVTRDEAESVVEQWVGLNLNPASDDFIGKRIGNQSFTWNQSEKKYKINGQYPNLSSHIRVELSDAVANGSLINKGAAPFGVHGPIKIADAFYGKATPNKSLQSVAACTTPHTFAGMFLGDADEVKYGSGSPSAGRVATAIDALEMASHAATHSFSVTVPANAGGTGNLIKIIVVNSIGSPAADEIHVLRGNGDETDRNLLIDAIKGGGNSGDVTKVKYGAGTAGDSTDGIAGLTAVASGTTKITLSTTTAHSDGNSTAVADITGNIYRDVAFTGGQIAGGDAQVIHGLTNGSVECKIVFPSLKLTTAGTSNGSDYAVGDTLGVRHVKTGDTKHDSYIDLVRAGPAEAGGSSLAVYPSGESDAAAGLAYQYSFSLDDVEYDSNTETVHYDEGSRATNDSLTAISGTAFLVEEGVAIFSSPLFGGFDGVDITEPNPFSNRYLGGNGTSHKAVNTNYAVYSFNKALDTIKDTEVAAMDLLSCPGLTKPTLTKQVLTVAATRGDCLAIIDPEGGLSPAGEDAVTQTAGSVSTTVTKMRGRRLNNSYGCAYYPWVRVDTTQASGIYMPPSVAAIGAMAGSDVASFPWFAPAGFQRGGLSPLGSVASGLSVVGTEEHLTKKNRDSLYSNNINPIARFPASNDIVVFGQKTLQRTKSALDRINVRRMMVYLKKQIGAIADQFLFEQNSTDTWNSFRAQASRVLDALRADGGISEYQLVLDDSTTTPDLVDRNILYAKVFVKPARAIEFIVVDFVITRTGADFGSY